jgi:hypothetical protein
MPRLQDHPYQSIALQLTKTAVRFCYKTCPTKAQPAGHKKTGSGNYLHSQRLCQKNADSEKYYSQTATPNYHPKTTGVIKINGMRVPTPEQPLSKPLPQWQPTPVAPRPPLVYLCPKKKAPAFAEGPFDNLIPLY